MTEDGCDVFSSEYCDRKKRGLCVYDVENLCRDGHKDCYHCAWGLGYELVNGECTLSSPIDPVVPPAPAHDPPPVTIAPPSPEPPTTDPPGTEEGPHGSAALRRATDLSYAAASTFLEWSLHLLPYLAPTMWLALALVVATASVSSRARAFSQRLSASVAHLMKDVDGVNRSRQYMMHQNYVFVGFGLFIFLFGLHARDRLTEYLSQQPVRTEATRYVDQLVWPKVSACQLTGFSAPGHVEPLATQRQWVQRQLPYMNMSIQAYWGLNLAGSPLLPDEGVRERVTVSASLNYAGYGEEYDCYTFNANASRSSRTPNGELNFMLEAVVRPPDVWLKAQKTVRLGLTVLLHHREVVDGQMFSDYAGRYVLAGGQSSEFFFKRYEYREDIHNMSDIKIRYQSHSTSGSSSYVALAPPDGHIEPFRMALQLAFEDLTITAVTKAYTDSWAKTLGSLFSLFFGLMGTIVMMMRSIARLYEYLGFARCQERTGDDVSKASFPSSSLIGAGSPPSESLRVTPANEITLVTRFPAVNDA
mmetsp:Transcript_7253/g.23067  ORF Transcript_7253/g.23067 Transcript_7253/m.23067 type:complete len:531 (-) Transcript_7253:213-1805(-)